MEKQPRNDNKCFCCGRDNEQGLKLTFQYPETGRAETEFTIPSYFTGWHDIVHGGLLSMLLDETMAHACASAGRMAVTAELTTRFHHKVQVGEHIKVSARVLEQKSKLSYVEGQISNATGTVVTSAKAKFLVP